MQVLPLRSASVRVCRTPARIRSGPSIEAPAARAIRSAMRKPTPNTLVSSYGVLEHHPVGGRAVVIADPGDQVAEAVGRQQQVKLAHHAQIRPRFGRLLGAAVTQPDRRERPFGIAIDGVEHVAQPVAVDEGGRPLGAHVLDAPEVRDHGLDVRGGQRPRLGHLDLKAVAPVIDPGSDDVGSLPLLEVDQRARRARRAHRRHHRHRAPPSRSRRWRSACRLTVTSASNSSMVVTLAASQAPSRTDVTEM